MFHRLIMSVVRPNPCPIPPERLDTRDILVLALLYLMFLILTKGVAAGTAITLAGKRFNVSEGVLREMAKERKWLR